ncbi:putative carbonic anhydrase [Helianthus annuus]|nr:putative carbonic anhydrase [Helianthus annuus]KAJ0713063.1 putative carbonic anhydrase [Helianthus annuus]KAJ0890334.1 putative carbonic anhydrase [Helianthus annuus]KAJ0895094.1 putative carbonic anhydrase [Helianthus annuus]
MSTTFDPIQRINDGFEQFKINEFNKDPDYYRQLAEKQQPKFLMFACSDSRVSPTNILNLRPGEAFMARNIANLVPVSNKERYSDIGAIIEYAVETLKVEVVLVIGHSRCGGIERLLALPDDETSYDFLDDWVSVAEPAKQRVIAENPDASGEELQTLVEKASVLDSLKNLLSYPYVQSGIEANTLQLLGGYYDFVRGNFQILETVTV